MGQGLQTLEQQLHIGGQIQGVRNDDDVEFLVQIDQFTGRDVELGLGHTQARGLDLARGEIDASLAGGLDAGK